MLLVLKRFFETKPLAHKLEIEKTQPALRAGVTLLPFFAVNWFLSVMALEDTITTAFQCIFAATNLVQCYLVFLFHCCQRYEVRTSMRMKERKKIISRILFLFISFSSSSPSSLLLLN